MEVGRIVLRIFFYRLFKRSDCRLVMIRIERLHAFRHEIVRLKKRAAYLRKCQKAHYEQERVKISDYHRRPTQTGAYNSILLSPIVIISRTGVPNEHLSTEVPRRHRGWRACRYLIVGCEGRFGNADSC